MKTALITALLGLVALLTQETLLGGGAEKKLALAALQVEYEKDALTKIPPHFPITQSDIDEYDLTLDELTLYTDAQIEEKLAGKGLTAAEREFGSELLQGRLPSPAFPTTNVERYIALVEKLGGLSESDWKDLLAGKDINLYKKVRELVK